MSQRRQFVVWIGLAVLAVLLFLFIMRAQYQPTQRRFALSVNPHPAEGRTVFEAKGCAKCHGADGAGSESGPSLRERASLNSLPLLVTSVWNHVPLMSEAMQRAHVAYPTMSSEEMAQLFAYLYVTGVTDQPGDTAHGRALFDTKGCARCHGDTQQGSAPAIAVLARADSPLVLTQSLWNHASAMSAQLEQRGLQWPAFQPGELRDLFAYLRSAGDNAQASPIRTGDPARGWTVFQDKACLDCHTLAGRRFSSSIDTSQTATVPRLRPAAEGGASRDLTNTLPATFSQFGESMLNHFPDMHRALSNSGKKPAVFQGDEVTDVAVFLYSLHYIEPSGSPHVGASVFHWRGCSTCHGEDASGGTAPALRGRGQNYTAVRLAMGLWAHGDRMYELTRRNQQSWPQLEPSDVGDLLSFLNTPLEKSAPKN